MERYIAINLAKDSYEFHNKNVTSLYAYVI